MEISLGKRETPTGVKEMEAAISRYLTTSDGTNIETFSKDNSIYASWRSGPTLLEFQQSLPNLARWSVIGTSQLVGEFRLVTSRSRYAIVVTRTHSLLELALATVRFRNAKNRIADTSKDSDLKELFEILEGSDPIAGFQLADLMSKALLDRTAGLDEEQATNSELKVLTQLCSYLDQSDYDALWNEAFSRIK